MDAATIRILLDADATGLARGFAVGNGQITAFQRNAEQSVSKIRAAFDGLSTGQKVLAGLGIGLTAAAVGFKAVIGPAIQFESAFAGVRKTVDGSPEQLAAIRDGLLDMSKVMPTSAAELASIAENAGQLGVKAADVLTFTRVVAELGETTDLSFDDAAQSLARFLNITGSGAAGIEGVSDVIVELGNNAATTESQIVDFGGRLASAFTVAGATEDQILGVASAFSSMGLRAEAGGSALSRIITVIADAATLGDDRLTVLAETAGLTTEEFKRLALSQGGAVEALLLVGQGLGDIQGRGEALSPVFDELGLSGLRTSEALRLLALNSDLVEEQLGLASNAMRAGGARAEEYAKRVETTASRLETFQNRLQVLAIELGTPLLDGFARSVDTAGDAIEQLFAELTPLGSALFTLFDNGADVVGTFYDALGAPALKTAVAALLGATNVVAELLELLNSFGPTGLAIVAVIADIALVGPVTLRVAKTVDALAASFYVARNSGFAAAQGTLAFQTALKVGPIIAVTAVLALLGKAFIDAGNEARRAGDIWENNFNRAVEDADYRGVEAALGRLKQQQQELEEATGRSGGRWGEFKAGFLSAFGQDFVSAIGQVQEMNLTLDELYERQERTQANNLAKGIELLATNLGITEDEALAAANSLGVVDEVVRLGADGLTGYGLAQRDVVVAIGEHVISLGELADKHDLSREKILNGEATLEDYGNALNSTSGQVELLADALLGVDFGALDPEEQIIAFDQLAATLDNLSGELGRSRDEVKDNILGVLELAVAHTTLRESIDGVIGAYQLQNAQQQITNELQNQFNEAIGDASSQEDFVALAGITRELAINQAALAGSSEEAIAGMYSLRDSVIEAAVASGKFTEEEAKALLDVLLLLEEEHVVAVQQQGFNELQPEVDELNESLRELGRRHDIEIALRDLASQPLDVVTASLNDYTAQEWIANLSARNQEALAAVAGATAATVTWDDILAVADLDADGILAEGEIARLVLLAQQWRDGDYTGEIDADGSQAEAEFIRFNKIGDDYKARDNTTKLTADGSQAEREIGDRKKQADDLVKSPYQIKVEALDLASGTLAAIRRYYDNLPNEKTITVRTRTGTIFADGGWSFANNGLLMGGARKESPGTANIYAATTPGRYFAEPETGGEAYIPLSPSKRQRSMLILSETARLMGAQVTPLADGAIMQAFASGGITTRQFTNGPGELPTVVVEVEVDATSIGQVAIDLDPVNRAVDMAATSLDRATTAADQLADAGPRVTGSLSSVANTAEDTGRRMALAMRPAEFLDTFTRISGWAKDSFRDFLGEWDGTTEQMIAKLDESQLPLGHIFRKIAEEGASSTGDIVAAYEESGIQMRRIAETTGREMLAALEPEPFFDVFTRISGWAKDSFVDWLAALDETNAQAVADMRESGASIEQIFSEVFSAREAIDALDDAGLEMRHIFRKVFTDGLTDAEILDAAIADIAESMTEVEDATRRANQAFDLLSGTSRDVLDAQIDYLDQIDRVKKAIAGSEDDGPGVFGLVGEEARRNYQDLLRAGDAMREYGLAIAGSGVSALEAVKQFDGLRGEFRKLATQAGLSKADVDFLTETLFAVPTSTIVEIAVEGEQAHREIDNLEKALDTVGNKRPVPKVGADITVADKALLNVLDQLGLIDKSTPIPKILANKDKFEAAIADALAKIKNLDGQVATTLVRNKIETTQTTTFAGGKYTIQRGDSWWAMAAKLYGDPLRYKELAAKNNADPNKTIYPGQVIRYADGGMTIERPGQPAIYPPHPVARVFAEPVTGGEAYIPLGASKRQQAMGVLLEVNRRFGIEMLGAIRFANGGTFDTNARSVVAGQTGSVGRGDVHVTLSAPMRFDIHATERMDTRDLVQQVRSEVATELDKQGRRLANERFY